MGQGEQGWGWQGAEHQTGTRGHYVEGTLVASPIFSLRGHFSRRLFSLMMRSLWGSGQSQAEAELGGSGWSRPRGCVCADGIPV